MDFGALPPEITSGLIYSGAGAGPLTEAAQAWSTLSQELYSAAQEYGSVITTLAGSWQGPSATTMTAAAQPYIGWLTSTAELAGQSAAQASAAATAYTTAYAATVPPPLIAANRAQLLMLVATNLLGQNTPAIAAMEAQYMGMWAQDAAAMNAYAATSNSATAGLPTFTPAPQTTSGSPAQAAATAGGWLDNSTTTGQLIQSLISSGFPFDVAQLFANFIGYTEIAAATAEAGNRVSAPAALPPIVVAPPTPAPAAPVEARASIAAASGVSNQVGRLSVPPSWAQPPGQKPPHVTVDTPTKDRYQAAIPAIPFMPVTGLRSNQGKIRSEPEFGHVSKVLPPRHPAGG